MFGLINSILHDIKSFCKILNTAFGKYVFNKNYTLLKIKFLN